jgi:peptidylprolyl isomerase
MTKGTKKASSAGKSAKNEAQASKKSEPAPDAGVRSGDTVLIHYTGKFTDGNVFDSSSGRAPLEFVAGTGMVIKGMDRQVMGMKKGEKKTMTIAPEEGYGLQNDNLLVEVPRDKFPPNVPFTIGMKLHLKGPNNVPIIATVMDVKEKSIVLDLNHPLAGKTLVFDMEVVEVRSGGKPQQP